MLSWVKNQKEEGGGRVVDLNDGKHLLDCPFVWLPIQLHPLRRGGRRRWRRVRRGGRARGTSVSTPSSSLSLYPLFCQVERISLNIYHFNYNYQQILCEQVVCVKLCIADHIERMLRKEKLMVVGREEGGVDLISGPL